LNRLVRAGLVTLLAVFPGACAADNASTIRSEESHLSQSSSTPASSTVTARTAEAPVRGLYSPPEFWDRTFTVASPADCAAAGERYTYGNLTTNRAWRLPRGALTCAVDADGGPLLSFDVFFDPPVDAPTALAVVSNLLPADAQQLMSHDLTNGGSKYPKYSQGSCHEVIFSSDSLRAAITEGPQSANIDQQDKVSVTLYSGNELGQDGADQPYQPDSIHLADVVQGDGTAGDLGVSC
jgi:hypothetical protein